MQANIKVSANIKVIVVVVEVHFVSTICGEDSVRVDLVFSQNDPFFIMITGTTVIISSV